MVKANRLIMVAILSLVMVATAGMASAAITVAVDTVQSNGHYVGSQTVVSSESGIYGYTYTFVPDGTYTVWGTVTNDGASTVPVWVGAGCKDHSEESDLYYVPANGSSSFTYTFAAASDSDVTVGYQTGTYGLVYVDLSKADWTNSPDTMTHTVDQGPMSNMVANFMNGVFDFGNSTLYSFV